ncbi:hypothetical protein ACLOJK_037087 [Asimina triloba]
MKVPSRRFQQYAAHPVRTTVREVTGPESYPRRSSVPGPSWCVRRPTCAVLTFQDLCATVRGPAPERERGLIIRWDKRRKKNDAGVQHEDFPGGHPS